MSLRRDQRGAVAAEFAVTVPAVILVVLLSVSVLLTAGRLVRLEQAVAQGARLAARGESDERVRSTVARLVDGATVVIQPRGELVCVESTVPLSTVLPLPSARASSCAVASTP